MLSINVMNTSLKPLFRTILLVVFLICNTAVAVVSAQPKKISESRIGDRSSVEVIPGEHYKAGALHRMIFGTHWRSLWTSPMDVEVLDLKLFAGGLKPYKKGGGFQTISLRFRGSDGKQYRFRTVDKDPARGMPKKLRNTVVSDVVQDQVSTANPAGVAVIEPLLEAAGVLHVKAPFFIMPYDREGLGEYYDEFAGLLGTLEEHPDENDGPENAFAGAGKVTKFEALVKVLRKDNLNRVDARAWLTARLVDVFIGDWDRHYGQWRWAAFQEEGETIWRPVPKDRDNAFSRQDGFFSWVITQIIPQIEGFDDKLDNVYFLTWSGRPLDRRIFPALSKAEWEEETQRLVLLLTDDLLEDAVKRMPPAMFEREGARLLQELKRRRDLLVAASEELYAVYAEDVDIFTSDKPEYASIERNADGTVSIDIYRMTEGSSTREAEPFYSRMFNPEYTSEIRLYLRGGDDSVSVRGTVADDIVLRVITGDGNDTVTDQVNDSKGLLNRKTANYFYDPDQDSVVEGGRFTVLEHGDSGKTQEDESDYGLKSRDYGSEFDDSIANLKLDYAPEYGAFLGWGVIFEDYAFGRRPYNYNMKFGGGAAIGSGGLRYKLDFKGDFRSVIDGAALMIDAGTTGLDIINFYGLGNESTFDDTLYNEDDFEIKQQLTWIRPTLVFPARSDYRFRLGFEAKFPDFEIEPGSWLDDNPLPYGINEDFTGGFIAGFRYENLDCGKKVLLSPRKHLGRLASDRTACGTPAISGLVVDLEGGYYPEFFGNTKAFGKLKAEGTAYLKLPSLPYSRLAMRVGGQKNWGDYPFYEAAYLGGSTSLRGYDKQRFAGDASLYANSELRLYLGTFKFLVPVMFGPLAFIDTGRVYFGGEDSDKWHTGYGGGLWFGFIESRYALSIAAGRGVGSARLSDDIGIYVRSGFSF